MASTPNLDYNFPHFSPPSQPHYPPPQTPNPPPLTPKVAPPLAPKVAPPSPTIKPPPHPISPPPPHPIYSPPPPFMPPSPPGHHSTIIIVVFVSIGGLLFLAFLAVAFCCFIKKKKKVTVEDTILKITDEHLKVNETIIPGPHGTQTVVLTMEEDVHIKEEEEKSKQNAEIVQEKDGLHHSNTDLESSSGSDHHGHLVNHKTDN